MWNYFLSVRYDARSLLAFLEPLFHDEQVWGEPRGLNAQLTHNGPVRRSTVIDQTGSSQSTWYEDLLVKPCWMFCSVWW